MDIFFEKKMPSNTTSSRGRKSQNGDTIRDENSNGNTFYKDNEEQMALLTHSTRYLKK